MSKGCFIVFEGIDGSGKSEQSRRLKDNLEEKNYKVLYTTEPTRNQPIGKLIRGILSENALISEEALALLFAADRTDHTIRKIAPALKEKAVVISDRYIFSSLAYQSKGMKTELSLMWLKNINRYAINPDIVIYLDISPKIGQKRLDRGQKRLQDHTYFENIIQQEKIQSVYYKIFNFEKKINNESKGFQIYNLNGMKVLRINGTLKRNKIEKIIFSFILKYFKEKKIEKNKKRDIKTESLLSFNQNK
jgi:dTMP kinase